MKFKNYELNQQIEYLDSEKMWRHGVSKFYDKIKDILVIADGCKYIPICNIENVRLGLIASNKIDKTRELITHELAIVSKENRKLRGQYETILRQVKRQIDEIEALKEKSLGHCIVFQEKDEIIRLLKLDFDDLSIEHSAMKESIADSFSMVDDFRALNNR